MNERRDSGDDSGAATRSIFCAPPAGPYQLHPGDRLADRFIIVQFLARGGMGEVYEASDEHLQGRHCALKTLRADIAAQPAVRQRFEREVLLAREVVHPNACPTYDLFRQDTPGGPLLFLTMKLLRGESLASRLHRCGRLEPAVALPVASQLAAALDAAHRAGVIHRDFKPGNVMLEGTGSSVHVTITDFGLSRLYESDFTLAATGQVFGTPGYIAPEVLRGHVASPAADIYAFGVVLHEMLTGKRPQLQPGSAELMRPSALAPEIGRDWDRVILGCLEDDPTQRFQSAGEAVAALDRPASGGRSAHSRTHISRRRLLEAAGVLASVAAAALWFGHNRIDKWRHPLPQQRIVALLPWPPKSPAQPLLRPILDAIASRLVRAEPVLPHFAVIGPGDLFRPAPKDLADVGSVLGANLVLGASLTDQPSGHTLALRLLDAGNGNLLRYRNLTISNPELSRLGERASAAAADMLDVPENPAVRTDDDEVARLSPTAYRLFSEAEDLRTQPNEAGLDAAIEKYQAVLEKEPRFAVGYADLSLAYSGKYQRTSNRAFLTLAGKNADLALRYNPDSAKGLLASAIVSLDTGNPQPALESLGKALRLDPGNPQILVSRAQVFRTLGRPSDEEQVYREVIRARPNYWRAYNELGWILYRQQRYQDAANAFAEAAAVAPRVALPLANEGAMDLLLGNMPKAEQAFRRSLERAPNELAYSNLGTIAFRAGDYRQALALYEKARDLNPNEHQMWRNIADCYAILGDSARSLESYQHAADLLSDLLRTNPRSGDDWATLAFYQAKLGHRADAEADLKAAEQRGLDQDAEFTKVQALAVLGREKEALDLLIKCIDRGLSLVDVDLALDLKDLRADPRYRRHIAQRGSG